MKSQKEIVVPFMLFFLPHLAKAQTRSLINQFRSELRSDVLMAKGAPMDFKSNRSTHRVTANGIFLLEFAAHSGNICSIIRSMNNTYENEFKSDFYSFSIQRTKSTSPKCASIQ